MVRFIGAAELAGGLGLVAMIFHIVRGEFSALPINVVFGALAAFVAWGRLKKAPIAPRRAP